MNIRTVSINALIAALYVVVTWLVAPFGFTHIQFRASELFNHLIVFNKKYFFGIVLGVFVANLIFSPFKSDLVFGLAHTIISLMITLIFARFIKNKIALMWINTAVFSFNMFIIAYMLKVFAEFELPFSFIWFTLAVGEILTMGIGIIIIWFINKRINFKTLI